MIKKIGGFDVHLPSVTAVGPLDKEVWSPSFKVFAGGQVIVLSQQAGQLMTVEELLIYNEQAKYPMNVELAQKRVAVIKRTQGEALRMVTSWREDLVREWTDHVKYHGNGGFNGR